MNGTLPQNPENDSSDEETFLGPEEDGSACRVGDDAGSEKFTNPLLPIDHAIAPSVEEHRIPPVSGNETCLDLTIPHTPTKQTLHPVSSPVASTGTATIDPAILFTPPNKILPMTPASSISPCVNASRRLSSMPRLSARQLSSPFGSPPRRTSIWRAQRNKTRAS